MMLVWFALAVLIAVVSVSIGRQLHERRLVNWVLTESRAIQALDRLNGEYGKQLHKRNPYYREFRVAVGSKAQFDGFNFDPFIQESLITCEAEIESALTDRARDAELYASYNSAYADIRGELLGSTTPTAVGSATFDRIEQKLFATRKLPDPRPSARVRFIVSYVSQAGRNSYEDDVTWDLEDLKRGLTAAREEAERMSSEQFRRQRERNLMTPKMRFEILKRDGHRCRSCGRTPADGVALHVDHITPVSKGGLTSPENLQVLCADCNLAKSDFF